MPTPRFKSLSRLNAGRPVSRAGAATGEPSCVCNLGGAKTLTRAPVANYPRAAAPPPACPPSRSLVHAVPRAGVVTAAVRAARDRFTAVAMLWRASAAADGEGSLVESWHAVATAEHPPEPDALHALCCCTLAGWGALTLSERVLIVNAAGYAAGQHPAAIQLPRPLLKAMAASVWKEGGAAMARELSLVAVRCRPFIISTPTAGLAMSILDACAHWDEASSRMPVEMHASLPMPAS